MELLCLLDKKTSIKMGFAAAPKKAPAKSRKSSNNRAIKLFLVSFDGITELIAQCWQGS
jgi:hypothetical protein